MVAEPRGRAGLIALLVALFIGAFHHAASTLWERWTASDSYYSHGPLVPVACLWILWSEREALGRAPRVPSALGIPVLILSTWLLTLGVVEVTYAAEQHALLLALLGVALVTHGLARVRRAWFPFCFALVFGIPLPGLLLDRLTLDLKLFAARITFRAVEAWGLPAVLEGATIYLEGGQAVLVDDLCSGLRSIVTLAALAVLFAYLQRSRARAVALLCLGLPLAVAVNVTRILVLTALAVRGTPAPAGTFAHEVTGFGMYALALVVLLAVHLTGRDEIADVRAAAPARADELRPSRGLYLLMIMLLTVSAGVRLGLPARSASSTRVVSDLPRTVGSWRGADIPLWPEIEPSLRGSDYYFVRFQRPGVEEPVDLYALHSDAMGLHPPDTCYTIQGYDELERRTERLTSGARAWEVNRVLLGRERERVLLQFWYRHDGRDALSHLTLRSSNALRAALFMPAVSSTTLRFSTPCDSGIGPAEERMRLFASEALPVLLERIP